MSGLQDVKESKDYNFPTEEEAVLRLWQELDAFREQLRRTEGKPEYSFYDGPPFATGLPHYGHLLAGTLKVGPPHAMRRPRRRQAAVPASACSPVCHCSSHRHAPAMPGWIMPSPNYYLVHLTQDIVTRYASGTGHHVTRRFGWDCHGLPVEYEIDKKLSELFNSRSCTPACMLETEGID